VKNQEYDDQRKTLRARSGSVNSTDPLVEFLYALMRDHLSAGKVERIMEEQVVGTGTSSEYTNGYLAMYAQDVAARLRVDQHTQAKGLHSTIEGLESELSDAALVIECTTLGSRRCKKCKRRTVVEGYVCFDCGHDNSI